LWCFSSRSQQPWQEEWMMSYKVMAHDIQKAIHLG
jgi:hypothetical protein